MTNFRFVCDLSAGDILVHALIWMLIILFTLGLGLLAYPYFFMRLVISHTRMEELGNYAGQPRPERGLSNQR